eukprot:gene9763-6847_t
MFGRLELVFLFDAALSVIIYLFIYLGLAHCVVIHHGKKKSVPRGLYILDIHVYLLINFIDLMDLSTLLWRIIIYSYTDAFDASTAQQKVQRRWVSPPVPGSRLRMPHVYDGHTQDGHTQAKVGLESELRNRAFTEGE